MRPHWKNHCSLVDTYAAKTVAYDFLQSVSACGPLCLALCWRVFNTFSPCNQHVFNLVFWFHLCCPSFDGCRREIIWYNDIKNTIWIWLESVAASYYAGDSLSNKAKRFHTSLSFFAILIAPSYSQFIAHVEARCTNGQISEWTDGWRNRGTEP